MFEGQTENRATHWTAPLSRHTQQHVTLSGHTFHRELKTTHESEDMVEQHNVVEAVLIRH